MYLDLLRLQLGEYLRNLGGPSGLVVLTHVQISQVPDSRVYAQGRDDECDEHVLKVLGFCKGSTPNQKTGVPHC